MVNNTLEVGETRTGFIFDDDERTPHMAATLTNDGRRIHLTLGWNAEYGQEYRPWFVSRSFLRLRTGDPVVTAPLPEQLEFEDSRGRLVLQGCRSGGWLDVLGSGRGQGTITVSQAIIGGRGPYNLINGLRSEIAGLGDWFGSRSLRTSFVQHDDGRLKRVVFELESPDPMRLHRRLNLTAVPSYLAGAGDEPDTTVLRERTFIDTEVSSRARSWDEHLQLHRAMRDLLSISSWRVCGFTSRRVCSNRDPERALSGDRVGRDWRAVVDPTLVSPTKQRDRDFLFTFADVGNGGIARWLGLHPHFARGMDPIISMMNRTDTALETQAIELAVGFEAIGYQLALDQGSSKRSAGREEFHSRLRRVASGLRIVPPFDLDEWAGQQSRVYNGLKHANRDRPEVADVYDAWRKSVIVFRLWVAGLVCEHLDEIRPRLERDRLIRPYFVAMASGAQEGD